MAYKVISGFQDLETEVFYDIHTEIGEENKNLKKYIKAGVVEKVDEEIIDEEIITEDTVEEEVVTNNEKKTENTKDAKKKG